MHAIHLGRMSQKFSRPERLSRHDEQESGRANVPSGGDDMAAELPVSAPAARRPTRRASANREALVVAARDLFADHGPAEVSIRTVADKAGCSHTLVGRQFGSKAGLEAAVIDRLAVGLKVLTTRMCSSDDWPMAVLIQSLRQHPEAGKLMVRCALGEFDDEPIMEGHTLGECLAGRLEFRRGGDAERPGTEAKIAAYGAAATVLGLIGFEDWLIEGTRTHDVPQAERDAAVADAAEALASLAVSGSVELQPTPHPQHHLPPPPAPDLAAVDSRTALVLAAVELLGARGPANLTTRDIAARAQVNQGLIYHYFESREHLFAEAIALANQNIQATAMKGMPLDLVVATRARLQSLSMTLMARLIVNGVRVHSVRTEFPVFDRLLDEARTFPRARDHRLVVFATGALTLGATLWNDMLCRQIGIAPDVDLVVPMATMTDFVLRHDW